MEEEGQTKDAMIISDGKIKAIGDKALIFTYRTDDTTMIDLHGKFIYPGFCDSHMHLLDYGITKRQIDLSSITSITQLKDTLRVAIKEQEKGRTICGCFEENWIVGGGFNQDYFDIPKVPTREDLDQVSKDRPIVIYRACLHIAVLNSAALKCLGIDYQGTIIEGGSIDCDKQGKPNGIVRENALDLLAKFQKTFTKEQLKEIAVDVMKELSSNGITSIHSDDFTVAKTYETIIDVYRELSKENKMTVRVNQQCLLSDLTMLEDFVKKGYVNQNITTEYRLGALKILEMDR